MRWTNIGVAATLGLTGAANGATLGGQSGGVPSLFSGAGGLLSNVRDTFSQLGRRQGGGTCGPPGNSICPGNTCCSQFGFCGEGDQFCLALVGCQPDFGWCEGEPLVEPTGGESSTPPTSTSPSGSPTSSSPSGSATPPAGSLTPSTNGMCGNSTTCAGSNMGGCCSEFFWCGDGPEYCGTGCQAGFGTCGGGDGTTTTPPSSTPPTSTPPSSTPPSSTPPTSTSSTPSSTPTASLPAGQTASTDGSCGNNVNCIGWAGGSCCSQFGFCGDGDYFCAAIAGCQPEFGTCDG